MLKKSLFSPALPQRAETRFFPCIVLASLRGSTYRSVRLASSLATTLPAERRVLARRGRVGEKSGIFEHPAGRIPVMQNVQIDHVPACPQNISIAY
jgi:hypothetical protein